MGIFKNFIFKNKNLFFTKNFLSKIVTRLKPTNQLETIYLNSDKSSWIKLQKIDDQNGLSMSEFEELCGNLNPLKNF